MANETRNTDNTSDAALPYLKNVLVQCTKETGVNGDPNNIRRV